MVIRKRKRDRVNPDLPINNSDFAEKGKVGFKKGNPGRPKGSQNEFTCLKDAFINAFIRIGGEDAIYEWLTPEAIQVKDKKGKVVKIIDMSSGRKEAFFKIISKMLPSDVHVSGNIGTLSERIQEARKQVTQKKEDNVSTPTDNTQS